MAVAAFELDGGVLVTYRSRMAAVLNFSRVKIVDEQGTVHDNVRIRMPAGSNKASIVSGNGRTTIAARDDVATLESVSQTKSLFVWKLSFADGSSWEVERRRGGCGCGR